MTSYDLFCLLRTKVAKIEWRDQLEFQQIKDTFDKALKIYSNIFSKIETPKISVEVEGNSATFKLLTKVHCNGITHSNIECEEDSVHELEFNQKIRNYKTL